MKAGGISLGYSIIFAPPLPLPQSLFNVIVLKRLKGTESTPDLVHLYPVGGRGREGLPKGKR